MLIVSVEIRISVQVKSGYYLLENPDTTPGGFGVILFRALRSLQTHAGACRISAGRYVL